MGEVGCLKDGAFQNLQVEGPIQIKRLSVATIPVPDATGESGGTLSKPLTAAQSGQIILCDFAAANSAIILPTATVGLNYTIILDGIANATTSTSAKIWAGGSTTNTPTTVTQSFWGEINIQELIGTTGAKDTMTASVGKAVTTYKAIVLCSNSTLTGGAAGDTLYIECVNAGAWNVHGNLHTSAEPAGAAATAGGSSLSETGIIAA